MSQETYIDRLCGALTDVLERAAGGSADRLAGYATNLYFWIDQAAHGLRVIDGYEERYPITPAATSVPHSGHLPGVARKSYPHRRHTPRTRARHLRRRSRSSHAHRTTRTIGHTANNTPRRHNGPNSSVRIRTTLE
jgi:hypothetical protein